MHHVRRILRQHHTTRTDGLTLIELLVTLAVIALIFAIATPVFSNILTHAQTQQRAAQDAIIDGFITDWTSGGYQVTDGTGENAGYLVAYRDANGNGTQDPDEPTMSRVKNVNSGPSLTYVTGTDGLSLTPVTTGTSGAVTYTLESGTLPAGVTLNPTTGQINAPYELTTAVGSVAVPAEVDTMTSLSDGSLIVSGEFAGTVTFPGLPAIDANTDQDISYIARLNPDNAWAWVTTVPGTWSDVRSIKLATSGALIVTGSVEGPASLAGTTLPSAERAFVGRLTSAGAWQWVRPITADIAGIAVTSDGGAVVGGVLYDPDLHPGAPSAVTLGATTLAVTGERTAIMAKISADGTWTWARQAGGTDYSHIDEVAANGSTAYFAMHARGVVTLNGTVINSGMPDVGYQANGEIVIVRVNTASGATLGITRTPTASADPWAALPYTNSLAIASDGALLLAGESGAGNLTFGSTTLTDPGDFVARMSPSGIWEWATGTPAGYSAVIYDVTATPGGGAVVTAMLDNDTFTAGTSSVSTTLLAAVSATISPSGFWQDVDLIAEGIDLRGYATASTGSGFAMAGRSDEPIQLGGRPVASPSGTRTGWIARQRPDGSALPILSSATVTIRATDASGSHVSKTVTVRF